MRRLDYEYVKQCFIDKHCELLEDHYINARTKMKYKCQCGNIAETTFDYFKRSKGCIKCQPQRIADAQKFSYEKVEQLFIEKGYKLLDKIYINSHTNMKCIHLECGRIVKGTYSSLQHGQGLCFKCGRKESADKQRFSLELIKDIFAKEKYKVLSKNYSGAFDKLDCECPKHHLIKISYHDFQQGHRCFKCNESKGERKVCNYLDSNKYNYKSQYKINDCKNILPLPFDFAIFNNDNQLQFLIEYDGDHHFEEVRGRDKLEIVQFRDSIKTNYCLSQNIPLLRIPYWDFKNIESILDSYFTMFKNNQTEIKQAINF